MCSEVCKLTGSISRNPDDKKLTQCQVIKAFVDALCPGLQVSKWPDKEERNNKDIDAIAGRFAIEHTLILTRNYQYWDDCRFKKVFGGLEDAFYGKVPFNLEVFVSDKDFSGSQKLNQDQITEVRSDIKKWIYREAEHLPETKSIRRNKEVRIPCAYTEIFVRKIKTSVSMGGVFFLRRGREDKTLRIRIKKSLDRKMDKLNKYSSKYTTILLIENGDISSMHYSAMLEAVQQACPQGLPLGLKELWYADTSMQQFRQKSPVDIIKISFYDFTKHVTV